MNCRGNVVTPIEMDGYNFDAGTGLVDAAAALDAADCHAAPVTRLQHGARSRDRALFWRICSD
jgi:hypothetical protein